MLLAARILVFLLGFACATYGLRQAAARSATPSGGLVEHLRAHRDDYDLIVLGSSFTRMHFLPPDFEQRMKELGRPMRAFGFGLSGLRGGELDFYLDQILALDMPNLKYLLCDVTLDQKRPIEAGNSFKRRTIYWHDPAQLAFMQRVAFKFTPDAMERAGYLWRHGQHAFLKLTNVGEGMNGLREDSWFGSPPRVPPRHAFHGSSAAGKRQLKLVERYQKNAKRHKKDAQRLELNRRKHKKPRSNGMMREWRDRIRAHGIEPIFVISPVLTYSAIETEVPGDAPLTVFDFNAPKRYPELYNPKLHYDRAHMWYGGAQIWSRLLADVMAARLDAAAGRPTAAKDSVESEP